MSNIRKIGILTYEQISALRYADTIEIKNEDLIKSQVTEIRCYKTALEEIKSYTFDVPSSVQITDETLPMVAIKGHVTFKMSDYNWELQTVFGLLKPLDELELIWVPVKESDLLLRYNLAFNELKVIVYRKKQRFHFNLCYSLDIANGLDTMFEFLYH